jgi:hypothetical protein
MSLLNNIDTKYEINNKLFKDGPFYITKSGYYYFTENIVINFYNTKEKFWEHQINNNFGFTAGIIIKTSDVEIDMCGFSIKQSIQDFCLQRFFALIQLNDMPFIIGKGPILEIRDKLVTPKNIIIKNGKFGLTSHQAILGNENNNVTLSNIHVSNFEVTGITLNNVNNLNFDNSSIRSSNSNIPLSPFFSAFIFIYRILMTIMVLYKDDNIKQKINIILNEIKEILELFINIIFDIKCLDELYLLDEKFDFFINKKKLSPCNVHGIKITGSGPSVDEFHKSINPDNLLNSTNINIKNITIENITASVDEELSLAYLDKIIHIGAGVKATFEFIRNKDAFKIIKSIKSLLNEHPLINKYLKSDIINNQIYDAIDTINLDNKLDKDAHLFSILRNCDSMGHINKGVIGARFGSIKCLNIDKLKISNIKNTGNSSTERYTFIHEYNIIKETYVDHGASGAENIIGSYSIGIISSSIVDSILKNISINNIKSKNSSSIGMSINNDSKNVTINNLLINRIRSNKVIGDSSVILIDENSKNIFVYNSFFNSKKEDKKNEKFKYLFLFFISLVILFIINLIPITMLIDNFKKIFLKKISVLVKYPINNIIK